MTARTAPALVAVLDRRMLAQFARYGLSGGAAVATHLAILVILIELTARSLSG
jgi:putative flippase GtrA